MSGNVQLRTYLTTSIFSILSFLRFKRIATILARISALSVSISQFFDRRRRLCHQAKVLSTIHRFGITCQFFLVPFSYNPFRNFHRTVEICSCFYCRPTIAFISTVSFRLRYLSIAFTISLSAAFVS